MYVTRYTQLIQRVGIKIAETIVRLVRHFRYAPTLQLFGYVVSFVEHEGLSNKNLHLNQNFVLSCTILKQETNHKLATEIASR